MRSGETFTLVGAESWGRATFDGPSRREAPVLHHFNLKVQNLRCKSLFFNSLPVSRLKVRVIWCHLKLFLAAALIGLFTLNGVSSIQLVAVIAFSAGIYAARFLPGTSNRTMENDRETERPWPT